MLISNWRDLMMTMI